MLGHSSNDDIEREAGRAHVAAGSPEAWLLAIADRRDAAAFARLFKASAPHLKQYLQRLGAADSLAEEATQEAMLMVWRKAHLFDPARARAGPWMRRIARNLLIDMLRRARDPRSLKADHRPAPLTPEELLGLGERVGQVQIAITDLGADQAMLVKLAFFEEQSHTEISRRLGIPLGTIKARVRRALGILRLRFRDLS